MRNHEQHIYNTKQKNRQSETFLHWAFKSSSWRPTAPWPSSIYGHNNTENTQKGVEKDYTLNLFGTMSATLLIIAVCFLMFW